MGMTPMSPIRTRVLRRALVAVVCLFSSSIATAGAWGVGAFENDDALDWAWELEHSNDLRVLNEALDRALVSRAYIEAPDGAAALAAAEVVAALRGQPHPDLPDKVAEWAETKTTAADSKLVRKAILALDQVRNTQHSELAQLFAESPEAFAEWKAEVADLRQRLDKRQ